MASSTLPMQNENGEPFPWPLDMIIEILKHVAAEDPIHIFPQLCTISKAVAEGLHANKDQIYGTWLAHLYPLSGRHVELMQERYPDDGHTYVGLVKQATDRVHMYMQRRPETAFQDVRRFGMGAHGSKIYTAMPGEEIECTCERILWTSREWPYVIHQLWLSVGEEAQTGLYNGVGRKAEAAQYQTMEFKIRAPRTPGKHPVTARWNMHYSYDQAIEGYQGVGNVVGWVIVPGGETDQALSSEPARYFHEARARRTSVPQSFHFARMRNSLPTVSLASQNTPQAQQTVHTFNIGPIRFNITVGPLRVMFGNDGPGSGLVEGGVTRPKDRM